MVPSQRDCSQSPTYSRSPKCHSGQVIPSSTSDSNGVVSLPGGVQSLVLQVGKTSDRFVCHQVQQQTTQVRISGTGSGGLGRGCLESTLGDSRGVCFSCSVPPGQGFVQVDGPGLSQNDSGCARVAQHVMVLGPGQSVKSAPSCASSSREPGDSAVQRGSPPRPQESELACLAPRTATIREQGFSAEVATKIEGAQRVSTRSVYKSKWTVFVKWCKSNEVDFRLPSVTQVADFLMHLFQDRKLQPSTIDGYRTAIADMIGNDKWNVNKDENLTRLLDSFHRDKPKRRRGVPTWNLSLVLNQLTKASFEPMRKASLKHLTFRMVSLLALGSGKSRSEIHAWLYRNIRHQENWSKVSL